MEIVLHYYSFNIGDYASHTRHLTLLEDLAYRRLLDLYYLHEQPLNECSTTVARLINMRDNVEEVAAILVEFFDHEEGVGYINPRADAEIEKFKSKQEAASRAGKASAQRRLNKRSTVVQPTNNHKPITNNQETKRERFAPPSVTEVAEYIKEKGYSVDAQQFVDFYSAKGWLVGSSKMRDWKAAVRTWQNRQKKDQPANEWRLNAI